MKAIDESVNGFQQKQQPLRGVPAIIVLQFRCEIQFYTFAVVPNTHHYIMNISLLVLKLILQWLIMA